MNYSTSNEVLFCGGAKGSRTPDLLNAIQTRYQLRYNPSCLFIIKQNVYIRQSVFYNFAKKLIAEKKKRLTFYFGSAIIGILYGGIVSVG